VKRYVRYGSDYPMSFYIARDITEKKIPKTHVIMLDVLTNIDCYANP
jgi:hypothetical protein